MLGLDRNDTIPVLLEDLWERIVEIATDPETPEAGVDLIPGDDIDIGDLGLDPGHDPLLFDDTDPTPDAAPADADPFAADDLDPAPEPPADHDATLDPGTGGDDLIF